MRGRQEHPRARGENSISDAELLERLGTSPRTRGKPTIANSNMCSRRNIPAHAGKTIQAVYQHQESPEHPRARGENITPVTTPVTEFGTSPRTRGKPVSLSYCYQHIRNIPAHAGKTLMRGLIWRLIWEHPRARGENENASPKRSRIQGTSPRTRGKQPAEMIPDRPAGNIPAHAGKTMLALTHHQPHWEHPRARGENFRYRIPAPTWGGTSPRTRGKQTLQKIGFMDQGNIPAHAGKTMPRTTSGRITQEHPRARGENTLALPEKNCPQGTSPRTRGKPPACWG